LRVSLLFPRFPLWIEPEFRLSTWDFAAEVRDGPAFLLGRPLD